MTSNGHKRKESNNGQTTRNDIFIESGSQVSCFLDMFLIGSEIRLKI